MPEVSEFVMNVVKLLDDLAIHSVSPVTLSLEPVGRCCFVESKVGGYLPTIEFFQKVNKLFPDRNLEIEVTRFDITSCYNFEIMDWDLQEPDDEAKLCLSFDYTEDEGRDLVLAMANIAITYPNRAKPEITFIWTK